MACSTNLLVSEIIQCGIIGWWR